MIRSSGYFVPSSKIKTIIEVEFMTRLLPLPVLTLRPLKRAFDFVWRAYPALKCWACIMRPLTRTKLRED